MARFWRTVTGLGVVLAAPCVGAQVRHPLRVAVGPFVGVHTGPVRSMVMSVLAAHPGEIELVSPSDTDAAIDRLGIRPGADDGPAVLGRDLLLDDVVLGSIEQRGRSWHLLLRVVRGSDGHSEGTASWDADRVDDLPDLHGEVWDEIHGYFHPDSNRTAGHAGRAVPGAGSTGTDTPVGTPDRLSEDAQTDTAPGVGWGYFALGGGVAGRSWRLPVLGEPTPRGYDNAAFGDVQLTLAGYYPFAHARMGLGVEASGALPVGLGSHGQGPDGTPVSLPTHALDLYAGASFVVRPVSGGSFKLGAGIVSQSFSVDTSQLPPVQQLAATSYLGLRVSGEAVMPLWSVPRWEFGLMFGGELRMVQVGQAMRDAYGAYPSVTYAYGAEFGVAVRLDGLFPGLGVRAWAEFLRYRTSFAGTALVGTVSDSVDDYTQYVLALTYTFGASVRDATGASSASTSAFSSPDAPAPHPEGDPFTPTR